ncbi:MAG TPA: Calx-beta domain-containing protein, partial [Gaiellaceae bacterium]|nr:Calx-beta domain-containing protein [Gaiellaceae bacterium]
MRRLLPLFLALVVAAPLASAAPGHRGGSIDQAAIAMPGDPLPELSIDDATVTEGNSGTVQATFTVTLTPASAEAVSVDYATADGTAVADEDYEPRSGTLTFEAEQTVRTINVRVRGDTLAEPDETYFGELSNATNATIADGQGLGTIVDDDGPP